MATILKKVGLKVVELDAQNDSIEGKDLVLGGTTYAPAELDKISANETAASNAQSAADAAQSTADQGVSDAASAQSTADQGVSDAANAQSTADQGVSDAANAQSTADQGVSDAANAQSTADQGVSDAANAQTAADAAQSTADNNTSSINNLANSSSFGPAVKAITATTAPAEAGTVTVPFADDDDGTYNGTGYSVDDLIIFEGNSAGRKIGKISAIATNDLTITYVGVSALVDEEMHHVKYNFLGTPDALEKRAIYAVSVTTMVKIADEVWDSAEGIALGSFTSGAGTVSSSDSVLSAIQKLDGNINNQDLSEYLKHDGSVDLTGSLKPSVAGSYSLGNAVYYYHEVASQTFKLNGNNASMYTSGSDVVFAGNNAYNAVFKAEQGSATLTTNDRTSTSDSGSVVIKTGDTTDGTVGNVVIQPGQATGTGESGYVKIQSRGTGFFETSGAYRGTIFSGDGSSDPVGLYLEAEDSCNIQTESRDPDTNSGDINIRTGDVSGTGEKGKINIHHGLFFYDDEATPALQAVVGASGVSDLDGAAAYFVGENAAHFSTNDREVADVDSGSVFINTGDVSGTGVRGNILMGAPKTLIGNTDLSVPSNGGDPIALAVSTEEFAMQGGPGVNENFVVSFNEAMLVDPMDPGQGHTYGGYYFNLYDAAGQRYFFWFSDDQHLSEPGAGAGAYSSTEIALSPQDPAVDGDTASNIKSSVETVLSSLYGIEDQYSQGSSLTALELEFTYSAATVNITDADFSQTPEAGVQSYTQGSAGGATGYSVALRGDNAADAMHIFSSEVRDYAGNSPYLALKSGGVSAVGDSGEVYISTGDAANGDSGDVIIGTGTAANGNAGSVIFTSLPKGSAYVAPSNDEDVALKKYVDDSLASAPASTTSLVAGEAIAAGDMVFLKADGKAWKVIADGSQARVDLELIFLAESAVASAASGEFTKPRADLTLSGGTAGAVEYVDATTAGAKTQTAPTATGTDVIMLGRWVSSTEFHFSPKYLMTN